MSTKKEHNEALVEALQDAQNIVIESAIDASLHEIAFRVVLEHILQRGNGVKIVNNSNVLEKKSGGTTLHKDFIEQKNPKNIYQRIACDVYYHTKILKNESISVDEIEGYFRELPGEFDFNKNSTNLRDAIMNTKNHKSYSYIEYVNKRDKMMRMSLVGIQLVERLPDQI